MGFSDGAVVSGDNSRLASRPLPGDALEPVRAELSDRADAAPPAILGRDRQPRHGLRTLRCLSRQSALGRAGVRHDCRQSWPARSDRRDPGGAPRLAEQLSRKPQLLDAMLTIRLPARHRPARPSWPTSFRGARARRDYQEVLDLSRRWANEQSSKSESPSCATYIDAEARPAMRCPMLPMPR